MRITSKGQVTIPKRIREQAGMLPGTDVRFDIEDDVVTVRASAPRGDELIEHLRNHRGDFCLSTEEIMELTRGEG